MAAASACRAEKAAASPAGAGSRPSGRPSRGIAKECLCKSGQRTLCSWRRAGQASEHNASRQDLSPRRAIGQHRLSLVLSARRVERGCQAQLPLAPKPHRWSLTIRLGRKGIEPVYTTETLPTSDRRTADGPPGQTGPPVQATSDPVVAPAGRRQRQCTGPGPTGGARPPRPGVDSRRGTRPVQRAARRRNAVGASADRASGTDAVDAGRGVEQRAGGRPPSTVGAHVKWHLHNAYVKLGVRSRSAALAHARALELLRR